jgi:hypothetical protein
MSARKLYLSLLVALAVPPACASDDKPPALGAGGGSGSVGAPPPSGSASEAAGGEVTAGAGAGGSQSLGGAYEGPPLGEVGGEGFYPAEGGAPPNPATLCRPDAAWKTTPVEGVNTGADERLLAMTPDELTLVFSRGDALFVLDDGALTTLTLPLGYTHALGVSLAADGLSLIVLTEDGLEFAEVSRAARGGTFEAVPSTTRFEYLNAARVTSGGTFSSPALSPDNRALYYTHRMGSSVANVWRAGGPQLSESRLQDVVTLGTQDGQAKLVVSVSTDERTLFVLDEALGHVTGLWSAAPGGGLTEAVAFEGFEAVIPNGACDRIYGTMELGGSLDVVTGTPR